MNWIFLLMKIKKNTTKSSILKQNFHFSEIFPYCPTAQMAEFMFPNVAYRATVDKTEKAFIGCEIQ